MIYINTLSERSALFSAKEHKVSLGNCEECKMYFHVHPSAELLLVTSGELTVHFLTAKSEKVGAGECAFIFPYQSHSYDRPEGTEYYRFNFMPSLTQSFFSGIGGKVGERSVFRVSTEEYSKFLIDLRTKPLTLYKTKGFLYSIISDYGEQVPLIERSSDDSVLGKIIDIVRSRVSERITLKEVAKALGYNEKYLSRLINQSSGLGFPGLVAMLKTDVAGYMLRTTDRTVADIAMACGFGSECSFYRTFREIIGCTPNEYRKTLPYKPAVNDAML
jgi:AraC-like DNA-binding protein